MPTKVECARARLESAALRYSRVGCRPSTPRNVEVFERATTELLRAAVLYDAAVSKEIER